MKRVEEKVDTSNLNFNRVTLAGVLRTDFRVGKAEAEMKQQPTAVFQVRGTVAQAMFTAVEVARGQILLYFEERCENICPMTGYGV